MPDMPINHRLRSPGSRLVSLPSADHGLDVFWTVPSSSEVGLLHRVLVRGRLEVDDKRLHVSYERCLLDKYLSDHWKVFGAVLLSSRGGRVRRVDETHSLSLTASNTSTTGEQPES